MPASIRDVAARANVSPATVSRVLNGREDVSAVLRDRVLAAVDDLGYRPYGPARSLRSRATTVLGIIVSDVTNPFFTSMVRGVEDVAQQRGYSVIIANADEDLATPPGAGLPEGSHHRGAHPDDDRIPSAGGLQGGAARGGMRG